jgi:hypothetical protein
MNKEKQVEEMAKILIDYKNKNHIMASAVILADYAEELYTAGYRKQSEVARDIFEEIDSLFERFYNDPSYSSGELGYDIAELKKKYTGDKQRKEDEGK